MDINWTEPFVLAFELGMFLLGSLLVLVVVTVAFILVFGLIKSAIVALRGKKNQPKQEDLTDRAIRKIFPVK
jgi:flagellar biosynthesis/type III secretory pathway M-ring protein FliF/YscJ